MKFVITFSLIWITFFKCEGQIKNGKDVVKKFMSISLSEDKISYQEINELFYFSVVEDSLKQKQHEIFSEHIKYFRSKYVNIYKSDKGEIQLLNDLGSTYKKIEFDNSISENVYVVTFKSLDVKPIYILLKENKIASFDYIIKGENGPSYFITY